MPPFYRCSWYNHLIVRLDRLLHYYLPGSRDDQLLLLLLYLRLLLQLLLLLL